MMDPRSSDEAIGRDIPSFIEPRPPLIHHPFMRPRPEKGINLLEKFEEDSDIEEPELVQVYLRMKPCKVPSNLYELRSDKCLVTSLDTTTAGHGRRTQHNVSKMYTFSRIFKPECTQKEIFEQVVKNNLKKLIDGHSFTLLTYGASGSGKTYTVMGTVNSPGLVPRALEYLFQLVEAAQTPIFKPSENGTDQLGRAQQDVELQWVKRHLQISAPYRDKYRRMSAQLHSNLTVSSVDLTSRTKYYVWVSFVEIYNEAIYDLLAPPDRRVKLPLREDSSGNVYVKGVTQAFVRSGEEAYDVMVAGKHNLVVAATGIHAHSSRSHCIFTITMLTEKDGEIRTSQVRLCDLAGCERQRTARNTGTRMLESKAINSSLHVLERCLHMLRRKQQTKEYTMVPYRECKLTRLLGSGLSGARGEAVTMVVTVNPAPQYAHESRHVLSLAVVAKDIQINNTIDPTVVTISSLECTQDSTVQDYNDDIMRLRTENERLHFELLQAQSCIAQLRRSMEEKQQQSASTMMELVEETKDMLRQFYEEQLAKLRAQMEEMEDDYESRLAVMGEELSIMKKTSDLEYKNRTRDVEDIEIQNQCANYQPDENEHAGRESSNLDPAYDSDSENYIDLDLDESLEPVNQLRKSIYRKEIPEKNESFVDLINDSSEEESENAESDNDSVNHGMILEESKVPNESLLANESLVPNESLAHDSAELSKESLYATGDDESEIENQSRQIENAIDTTANLTLPILKIIDKDVTVEVDTDKNDVEDTNTEKDKSEREELFNVSTKIDKTQEVIEKDVMLTNLRGTYFVSNEPQEEHSINQKLKTLNTARGTYFVADREMSFYKKTFLENGNEKNKELLVTTKERNKEPPTKNRESPTEFVKPKNVANTLVSKIMKSFKTRQSSGSSLRQFEQLEQAVNNDNNSTGAPKRFEIAIPTQIFKGKRYFDDTSKEISTEENDKPPEPNDGKKREDITSKYFEEKPDESNLSSAAKTQEKRLLFDSPETSSTSSDIQNKSKSLVTGETLQNLILTPKIPKEAKLYYTTNDKVTHNDVLISRSPSIVRDDVTQEYEPSVAMKKILGENFSKPEILSSTQKDKLNSKKHESVDIFESPLSSITKASSKEISNIDVTANKNAEEPKDINSESTSLLNSKVKGSDIAYEFIESLVASQKIKAYVKREQLALAKSSGTEKTATNNTKNHEIYEEITKEIKEETLLVERTFVTEPSTIDYNDVTKESEVNAKCNNNITLNQPFNDTQTSKGNNTVDEFENIVKNLTNMRATEFDLLIAEEDNVPTNNKTSTQEPDTDASSKERREITERRKKLDEPNYNLRNRGKSNLNLSDDKKDKEQVTESSKVKSTTKKCLRLRRRKNLEVENFDQDNENKFKDIGNLKKQFCDVTMGLPAAQRDIKDIPSPEKLPGEEENVPPMMGIQSCPSKSVIRSRRKLFTPRAEPLEESLSQAGDSNERLVVPRPSFHRARARRKL